MANRTRFAGRFRALEYYFGGTLQSIANLSPGPLVILTAPLATGSGTVTLENAQLTLTDGVLVFPLAINAPLLVGLGTNQETVTPTAVTNPTSPVPGLGSFTATFANLHGIGDPVASASFGLQEAINDANTRGGGIVVIDAEWYAAGGTTTIILASGLPTNGTVQIEDVSTSPTQRWSNTSGSVSLVAAPLIATTTQASSNGLVGTWTAGTVHAVFTYVTADGGETVTGPDFTFTSVLNQAVGGTGPIAATGAVGYRVYLSTVGGSTDFLVPLIAANGTLITAGPILAFRIGTNFSVATPVTAALATVPVQSTAFATVQPQLIASGNMAQLFQTVYPPFTATGVVTFGTAKEWGKVQIPTGFLNQIGRTLRISFQGNYTPVSTATVILSVVLHSVYGTTSTTVFTITTAASSGTGQSPIYGQITMTTAATGATGTIECHGWTLIGLATAGPSVLSATGDTVFAPSSAVDLTKQDTIQITINSGTANLTTSQLRSLIVEVLQ